MSVAAFNIKKHPDSLVVALAGNPNTGKSTIFNALTGLRQHTGNWPGKTVVQAHGTFLFKEQRYVLVDLPGTYSLLPGSPEELVARDFLCSAKPDTTIVVVDATCLERNLNLLLQVIGVTHKVVVCVNLVDEAERKGIVIKPDVLAQELGVPVVTTVARKGKGLDKLIQAVHEVATGQQQLAPKTVAYKPRSGADHVVSSIYQRAEAIAAKAIEDPKNKKRDWNGKADRILTSRLFGYPAMLLTLGVVFWITLIGAEYPSQALYSLFFWLEKWLSKLMMSFMAPDWLHGLLVLGVYRGLAWVVAVMLPPMAIFFPLFTLLEDLGYLPRVAFNLDGLMRKAGAHGKQSLTMSMGFGCNAAGVIACRIIDSPRERLIAILTNNFVPCNGRFPLMIALASIFVGGALTASYSSVAAVLVVVLLILTGIITTLVVSWILSKTLLKGIPSSFVLELPPYRRPQIGQVIIRSVFDRTAFVLMRAIKIAAPAGAVVWFLANFYTGEMNLLAYCAGYLDPFARLMGLDGMILLAFILGLPANEIVLPIIIMGYLAEGAMVEFENLMTLKHLLIDNGWTLMTALSVMLFSLLHYPCATTLLTIKKETQSWKWTLLAAIIPLAIGVIVLIVLNLSVGMLLKMI